MYSCYAQYSIATMDTDDYGLCHPETGKRDGPNNTRVNCSLIDGYPYADSGSGFTWTSAKENFGVPFAPDLDMQVDGMLGSYDGSGFVRDIKPAPDQYAVAPGTSTCRRPPRAATRRLLRAARGGLPTLTVDRPRRAPERVVRKMRLACS